MFLTLKVIDSQDNIVCTGSGEDFVDLVCKHTYQEGDRIELTSSEEAETTLETDRKSFLLITI